MVLRTRALLNSVCGIAAAMSSSWNVDAMLIHDSMGTLLPADSIWVARRTTRRQVLGGNIFLSMGSALALTMDCVSPVLSSSVRSSQRVANLVIVLRKFSPGLASKVLSWLMRSALFIGRSTCLEIWRRRSMRGFLLNFSIIVKMLESLILLYKAFLYVKSLSFCAFNRVIAMFIT